MMENKTRFKECPKCKGWIPEQWPMHEKCGWNVPPVESPQAEHAQSFYDIKLASMCLSYAKDLICSSKADLKDLEKLHERLMKVLQ